MARTYKPIKQSLDEKYGNETPSRNIANAIDRGLGNTIQHNTIADAKENTPATPAFERTSKVIGEYTNPEETSWTFKLKEDTITIEAPEEEATTANVYSGKLNTLVKIPKRSNLGDLIFLTANFSSGVVCRTSLVEGHFVDPETGELVYELGNHKWTGAEVDFVCSLSINMNNNSSKFTVHSRVPNYDGDYETILGDSVTVSFEVVSTHVN